MLSIPNPGMIPVQIDQHRGLIDIGMVPVSHVTAASLQVTCRGLLHTRKHAMRTLMDDDQLASVGPSIRATSQFAANGASRGEQDPQELKKCKDQYTTSHNHQNHRATFQTTWSLYTARNGRSKRRHGHATRGHGPWARSRRGALHRPSGSGRGTE